jgi:tetratricopeptide (TPR) repeat protein
VFLAAGLLVAAALGAFADCFQVPFLFDDFEAVTDNTTIRHLWPLWPVLDPPGKLTVGGRPVLNLSYALNYAVGGKDVWGYHAINLAVHILAGLALFGIARRTLQLPSMSRTFGDNATWTAAAIALLWLVHPVQTESVTYISQRAESMMGLFYLLTLYAFIRAAEPETMHTRAWTAFSITACLLGMATKEVMITAPIMALVYDRTFLAGTFREAWRLRWRLYAGLMATWLFSALLMHNMGERPIGYGYGVSLWHYALTECDAITHYLELIVWPHPQHLDYGLDMASSPLQVLPEGLIILALLAATAVTLVYRPKIGFAGAWFFIILAPTSSFVPVVVSPIAEHRLYLPLAGPVALAVLGLYRLGGKWSLLAPVALALVWGTLTFQRNIDYLSPLNLWKDAVDLRPDNPRAQTNYGIALLDSGDPAGAVEHLETTLQLSPTYPRGQANLAKAENNWGNMLVNQGHNTEAIPHFERALKIQPLLPECHYNWGNALYYQGKLDEAIAHYKESIREDPNEADARNNWGMALLKQGHPDQAIPLFQEALQINPALAEAHFNWGRALAMMGHIPEAIAQFQETLRLDPNFPEVRDDIAKLSRLSP